MKSLAKKLLVPLSHELRKGQSGKDKYFRMKHFFLKFIISGRIGILGGCEEYVLFGVRLI